MKTGYRSGGTYNFIENGHRHMAGCRLHFCFNMGAAVLLVRLFLFVYMLMVAAALLTGVYRLVVAGADTEIPTHCHYR